MGVVEAEALPRLSLTQTKISHAKASCNKLGGMGGDLNKVIFRGNT